MNAALEFVRVSKQFTLQHERPESLQERFVQGFRRPAATTFWALRDVSFAVRDGETFGILGRNGAGKSTLLKLATGILQPTSGQVTQHRRTYAMLELGAGFHPDLSGRDNIILNGSIHGLSRDQTRTIFDKIVDFAELEEFIDTPVKHYSSGMYMRLGFATAINMNPELLVIDEILAVGDASFRRKCTDALWSLRRQGVTILFVSHNEEAIYQFCDRALLLSHGQIAALGDVDEVASVYARLLEGEDSTAASDTESLAVRAVAVRDARGRETLMLAPDEPWAIDVVVTLPPGPQRLTGEVVLQTDTGSQVLALPLDVTIPGNTVRLRPLRLDVERQPLSAGRLRVRVNLEAFGEDGAVTRTAYEAAHSITIGETGHGPLVQVPHRWTDRLAAPIGFVLTDINFDGRAAGQVPSSEGKALVACFVEGVTGPDQSTRLVLSNPGQSDVQVRLSFAYGEASSGPAAATLVVGGGATRSVDLGDIVGFGAVVSVVVTADHPLVCRRLTTVSAYPGPGGLAYNRVGAAAMRDVTGAHVGAGITAPAPTWWFAEGYTGPGFETYLAIANIVDARATVTIDYRLADGSAQSRQVDLGPMSCRTVAVHDPQDPLGVGPGHIFFASVTAANAESIAVERITYCRYDARAGLVRGVAVTAGVPAPAQHWWFPVGREASDWDGYLVLANPHQEPAAIQLTVYSTGKAPAVRYSTLSGGQRTTLPLHGAPSLDNPAIVEGATSFHVSANAPILAERLLYGRSADGNSTEADIVSASSGLSHPLASGASQIFVHSQEYGAGHGRLVLVNPGLTPAEAMISAREVSQAGSLL